MTGTHGRGGGPLLQRTGWLLAGLVTLLTPALRAQLAPIGTPRGVLRLELGGEFRHADSRYLDGTTQDLGATFTWPALSTHLFPTLTVAEDRLAEIVRNAGVRLLPGQTRANALMEVGTGTLGAAYGLTSRITLFATVPIVQTRVQARVVFDSAGGSAGFNPANPVFGTVAGRAQTLGFLSEFDAALTALNTNLSNGTYDGNPAQKAQAQAALDQGIAFRESLGLVLDNPDVPFVPLATSTTGTALLDSISTYQSALSALNISGFSSQPALADRPPGPEEFSAFLGNPGGPAQIFPLEDVTRSRLGDIEAGVAVTLVDRWDRDRPGGFRLAVEGRVRFPTGLIDRSDDVLDVGTGSGHFAAGVRGVADLGRGALGIRLTGGYLHQFAALLDRRVASPLEGIPFASRLTTVRREPGSLVEVGAAPFFRLVTSFALMAGVDYRRHAGDQVSYATPADSIAGVPASVLARSTAWNLTSYRMGITYQAPALRTPSAGGLPIEASWMILGPLSSSEGLVPKERAMQVRLRWYTRFP